MTIIPKARPTAARGDVLAYLTLPAPPFPFLVARRGYYGDSMGTPGANDLNIYDDAIFLVEADRMTPFNANCDPGKRRPGMATLAIGQWRYRVGIHNLSKDPAQHPHYEALVQAAPVTVHRDGGHDETGYFGVNIHCGGNTVTSSEGCQTIPPGQWGDKLTPAPGFFLPLVKKALLRESRTDITYVLTSRYA